MHKSKYMKLISLIASLFLSFSLYAHSDAFKSAFGDTLVAPYLQIQQALAGDNITEATTGALAFAEAMKLAPVGIPPEQVAPLTAPAAAIVATSDIASARKSFEELSVAFTSLVSHVGTSGKTALYQAYCPMAFGGKGAVWLQDGKTVSNPYYGSQMLRCGSVQKQVAGMVKD